jgi:hypothetical protein
VQKVTYRVNPSRWPQARTMRATTVEPPPSYGGLCARPPAIEIGRGAALIFFLALSAREGADGQAVVCPLLRGRNKATATNHPCQASSPKSPIPKERLRVSNWIVQRLYDYAVSKTVEL